MKKKLFLLVAVLLAVGQNAFAYDFSAVAPSGQTLYYKIIDSVNHYVMLTHPKDTLSLDEQWSIYNSGSPLWNDNDLPTGALVLPETVQYDGVTYTVRAINNSTFAKCPIYSVVMANTIDSLAGRTFWGCNYLINVTFSNSMRYIGNACFEGAYLGDVVLPPSVRILKEAAFISSHITSIVLNDSLEVMESLCLTGNQITSLYIPASVKSINNPLGDNYGGYNGFITSIVVDPNNPYYDSRNNCNAIIESSTGNMIAACRNTTIPEGIISFDSWLFGGFSGLDTLVLPSTLMRMYCNNYDPVHIKHLVINSPSMVLNLRNPWGHYELYIDTIHVLPDTPPFWFLESNPEESFFSHTVVIVPCNSLQAYQTASVWSNFTNMMEYEAPQITVNAENGSASVVTYPTCTNDTATVNATADNNYHFVRWSDGSTQNPYTLVLNSNTTLTALFAIDSVNVTATTNPLKGAVLGGGTVPLNVTTTLTAIPSGNNIFLSWSNGVTDNPYTLTVTTDTALQALFTLPDTLIFRDTTYINHYIHDTTFVNNYVHDTTIQYVNQYVHDTTFVNNYVHDTTIQYVNQYVHDTTFINNYVHDTVRLTTYVFDTTIVNLYQFDTAIHNQYSYDTTIVNLSQYDTTLTYVYDTTIINVYDTTIVNNFQFDTMIFNTYTYDTVFISTRFYDTIYVHDTVYITEEGIDGVETLNAKVYSNRGQIVVEGADGNPVTLYDVTGRVLATRRDEGMHLRFDAPASGTYLIKIGNYPARRVVVIR